jgi:multidrug efflux pump subunit AcrB
MDAIGYEIVHRLQGIPGLRNVVHSSEELVHELAVTVDRERATALGLTMDDVAQAVRVALDGNVVTDYLDGDRTYDVRLRLPRQQLDTVQRLEGLVIAPGRSAQRPVYLADLAKVSLVPSQAEILRDNQRRVVEVSASISQNAAAGEVLRQIKQRLADLPLSDGYSVYEAGVSEALQHGRVVTGLLLGLALFLVFVVMAVQYESLRDPLVILLSVPFAAIGVALGLTLTGLPLSMPVWLGMIMLAGIVVNNAIVLVEYIEILRERGNELQSAIVEAARLRLRPILMTTLTTAVGLLPLALGLGEGAEMLQPLAVTIVSGLLFSMLVSLFLVPILYLHISRPLGTAQVARDTDAQAGIG